MKEKIDEIDKKEESVQDEIKKKLEKDGFFGKLAPYGKPAGNIILGMIVSCIKGCVNPVLGILIAKMLFALMYLTTEYKDEYKVICDRWALYMFICSLVCLFSTFCQKFAFGVVGENITKHIRKALYSSLLKKNMGWFDLRENAPGVLTSALASDAQAINGASTEGVAVMLESFFALACAIALGFYFSWKLSLIALACTPFNVLGGVITSKMQAGMSEFDKDAYKDANLLAGDAINNYRTVASFGHDYLIIKQYLEYVKIPEKT